MENSLALLEEKAEKALAAMCREKERLQRQAVELRRQLLLRQKQQELSKALDAQVDLSMLPEHPGTRGRENQSVTNCTLTAQLRLLVSAWCCVRKFERKGSFWLILLHHCLSLKVVRTGTHTGQEPGGGSSDREAMKEPCLLACSLWLAQPALL